MKHTILALTAAAATSMMTLAGCATPDTPLETAFCDGLQAPAEIAVTAADSPQGAPDVTAEGRVDIELLDDGESYWGFVTYEPDETGSFAFGLTADVNVVVRDAAGNEVPIDQTVQGATECDELAVRHTVSLEMEVYTLEIGPSDTPLMGLIAEESNDDL